MATWTADLLPVTVGVGSFQSCTRFGVIVTSTLRPLTVVVFHYNSVTAAQKTKIVAPSDFEGEPIASAPVDFSSSISDGTAGMQIGEITAKPGAQLSVFVFNGEQGAHLSDAEVVVSPSGPSCSPAGNFHAADIDGAAADSEIGATASLGPVKLGIGLGDGATTTTATATVTTTGSMCD